MKLIEIIQCLEAFAPPSLQEDYDNSGLQTGEPSMEVTGALLTLDCTEEVLDEAIAKNCNMVVAHHPVIFGGIKRLTGSHYVERVLIKAIRNNIAIYACHTNIDNVQEGVNRMISSKLGLTATRVLLPKTGMLRKLVTYVPQDHEEQLKNALYDAGAGHIGNYDHCSFSSAGTGTFRGNELADPFIGIKGEESRVSENRVEVIFERHHEGKLLKALRNAHPYEEPAFDVFALENHHPGVGSGMVGELEGGLNEEEFLKLVKAVFRVPVLKHTKKTGKIVKKVAVCGGSGRFLLKNAIHAQADAFITADFKYHEFFDADDRLLLVDVGHYESEQYTPELFYTVIREKFSTFAVHLSKINTNPVNYF